MKRTHILWAFIVLAIIPLAAHSQDEEGIYYFDYMDHRLDDPEVDDDYVKDHPLGREVAMRLEALRQKYTYMVEGSATAPQDRRIVEKPVLYYSVQKLESFYKKQFKKGGMNASKAAEKLVFALDVAMLIRYQQTDVLEKEIKKLKGGDEIAQFFDDKVKIRF